jgi:hypothetical protein
VRRSKAATKTASGRGRKKARRTTLR